MLEHSLEFAEGKSETLLKWYRKRLASIFEPLFSENLTDNLK